MTGGDQPPPGAPAEYVIATYREIADRLGLGSVDAARVRAKRAKWEREPTNHPLDPVRVRVPLSVWEQPTPDRPRTQPADRTRLPVRSGENIPNNLHPNGAEGSDPIKSFDAALATLREQLDRERQRADAAETEVRELRQRAEKAEEEARTARGELATARAELERFGTEAKAPLLRRLWRALLVPA